LPTASSGKACATSRSSWVIACCCSAPAGSCWIRARTRSAWPGPSCARIASVASARDPSTAMPLFPVPGHGLPQLFASLLRARSASSAEPCPQLADCVPGTNAIRSRCTLSSASGSTGDVCRIRRGRSLAQQDPGQQHGCQSCYAKRAVAHTPPESVATACCRAHSSSRAEDAEVMVGHPHLNHLDLISIGLEPDGPS